MNVGTARANLKHHKDAKLMGKLQQLAGHS